MAKDDDNNKPLTLADLAVHANQEPGKAPAQTRSTAGSTLEPQPSSFEPEAPVEPAFPAEPFPAEPLADPYQVPVTFVDTVGPFGLAGGIGSLTLVTHRNLPGTTGAAVEPIVSARLRFTMPAAAHLHNVLGLMLAASKG